MDKSAYLSSELKNQKSRLHPAAAGVLLDGLRDAAHKTQVMVTSHSPDFLDTKDLDVDSILAVEAHDGNTAIAGVDKVGRAVLRDKLFTTGELLRNDQLQPDPNLSVADAKVCDNFLHLILKIRIPENRKVRSGGR